MIGRRGFLLGLAAAPIASTAKGQLSEPRTEEVRKFRKLLGAPSSLIVAARQQIGVTVTYDPAYISLNYPGGDIDRSKGVCTDVIVRAYRDAFDYDLQQAIHEDMTTNFSDYPDIWGLTRPDKNIDHRRVPNIETFLKRGGYELPSDRWYTGDLITCRIDGRLPHIGIVATESRGLFPFNQAQRVIHNIGGGTREERVIGLYKNERRFRFFPYA